MADEMIDTPEVVAEPEEAEPSIEQVIASLKAVIQALDGPACNLVMSRLRAEFGG